MMEEVEKHLERYCIIISAGGKQMADESWYVLEKHLVKQHFRDD